MNRKQEREASKYDWNQVFSVLNKIRDELRDNFPFHVLQVDGAEADDMEAEFVRNVCEKEIYKRKLCLDMVAFFHNESIVILILAANLLAASGCEIDWAFRAMSFNCSGSFI